MSTTIQDSFDETGKVILDSIYNRSDPRLYFSTLNNLDYLIPQFAKPVFQNLVSVYRAAKERATVRVVDLGCSYGVNAALLKRDFDMAELYSHYGAKTLAGYDRADLIARDREWFNGEDEAEQPIEVIGVDAAANAVAYARQAEIIDGEIAADLEETELTERHRQVLKGSDLIISTGCVGYITQRTIGKIVDAARPRRPWMAHFVLRMFPFEDIRQALAEKGYVTLQGVRTYRQRRFACTEEQEQVLDRLIGLGVDPSGIETEGWFHADLYISRPAADTGTVPAAALIPERVARPA